VLTGEGRLDSQTAYGKTVARVADLAAGLGVPVTVIAGSLGDGWETVARRVAAVEVARAPSGESPAEAVSAAAERALRAVTS
jgi:glycerate kinase